MKKHTLLTLVLALLLTALPFPVGAEGATAPITVQTALTKSALYSANSISVDFSSEDSPVLYASSEVTYESFPEKAGKYLRAQIMDKTATAYAYYESGEYTEDDLTYHALEILSYALEHTGQPFEGDFLSMDIGSIQIAVDGYVENDRAYLTYVYEFGYYTSPEQNAELNSVVDTLVDSFDADKLNNYDRFVLLYDYICNNVTYTGVPTDSSPLEEFTAYGALINGKANSYGISQLLYRLGLELGIDNRIVMGEYGGNEHAWNVISMGRRFYHVDASLDSGKTSPSYFLRGSKSMTGHTMYEEYTVEPFISNHPIDTADLPAENAVDSSGTCGENLTWTLDIRGTMTISGTGDMEQFPEHGQPWYGIEHRIKCLVVEDGVTSISSNVFYQALYLTNVILPDSLQTLEGGIFRDCWRLRSINIPEGITEIRDSTFSGCKNLNEIILPSSIAYLGDQAFGGTGITTIKVPKSCTTLDIDPFQSCLKLEEIVIEEGNPAYTSVDGVVYDAPVTKLLLCPTNKAELVVPDTVTAIDRYSSDNTNLVNVIFGKSVELVQEGAFSSCPNLEAVLFTGPAPTLEYYAIHKCVAYYPANDLSYSEEYRAQNNDLDWVPYCDEHETAIQGACDPTCEENGYTGDEVCQLCGAVVVKGQSIPATGHNFQDKFCTVCGSGEVIRIAGSNRYETAFLAADQLKIELGIEKFENIIVASGTGFADALAGSYLAVCKNAPILLVNKNTVTDVAEYIEANLADRGTVYLLGGNAAVPASMEDALEGLYVERLAGSNRYETNLMILEEAGFASEEILVCTGNGFADSLSASAVGKPILLVNKSLTADQKEFLESTSGEFVIIGGEGAVSAAVENKLGEYGEVSRLAGANRYETSVLVAERFFEAPTSAVVAYSQNFPDGLCGGPLAYATDSPLLLMATNRGDNVIAYANEVGIACGAVLGGTGLIDDATAKNVFSMK